MFGHVLSGVALVAAAIAPIAAAMLIIGATQVTRNRTTGFLYLAGYLILLNSAFDVLTSGRSLDNFNELLREAVTRHPLAVWLTRGCTVFLIAFSCERIINGYRRNGHILGSIPALTSGYLAFWVTSVGITMFFAAHPYFSHEFVYPVVIGLGLLSQTQEEAMRFSRALRDSIVIVLMAGLLLIPVKPSLVIETTYSQGYLGGLPRLAGVLPHAVMEGFLALLLLMLVWAHPYGMRNFNRFCWLMGVFVLILAQSKTAWIASIICVASIYWTNHKADLIRRFNDPLRPHASIVLITAVAVGAIVIVGGYYFGGLENRLEQLAASREGQQLTSLTGRDIIWEFALNEWSKSPILGFGTQFLSLDQRLSIGLPNATHAHNQFIDVLARSGLVGLLGLVAYLFIAGFYAFRYAAASRGLTMALYLALMFRAISEIPFAIYGYGIDMMAQFSMLMLFLAHQTAGQTTKPAPLNMQATS